MTTKMTSTIELPTHNLEADYTSHPAELVRGGVRSLRFSLDFHTHPQYRKSTRNTPPKICAMLYPRIASSHPISGHSGISSAILWLQEH